MPLTRAAARRAWHRLAVLAWLVVGRNDAAERILDAMVDAGAADDAWVLASRSHLRAQRGAFELAVADAERLVERFPDKSAANWFNLAFQREQLGRYADAEAAFRRAVALDAKLDRAWYGLALVLIRLGRLDEAAEALKRNTELQPMSPYGWYQLARVQADRQHPEQAARIVAHLKTFEPKVAAQLEREIGLAGRS